ncbi:zonular occludens toxin domain-containing protein [Stenotrophomonas maltophilia]|uniref:zonular occludens toxin domain-containing protein n=1 Tax=Stenotrophomonas maltophilia TaxID=40324 RepID=UPI001E2D6012|nr:zonular occludens toxin domain-containing protein [Stenotrophomonas maltophilia]
MALYLVTGQPGHGKTAYALDKAFKFQKEGRAIYAHGVKDLDYSKAGWSYLDDPKQWETLPDGAVILLDECYTVFPNRNPGAAVPPHIQAMATHRHRGFDFIMVAQQGLQLDPFLRGLYEEHVHVRQTSVIRSKTKLKRWNQYQSNVQAACNDELDWVRPKYVFDYYTSTTLVTTKRQIPMWIRWVALGVVVLLVLLLTIRWYFSSKIARYDAERPAAASPLDGSGPVSAPSAAGAGAGAAVTYNTTAEYAKAHLPRIGTMPWTAPIYDQRGVTTDPQLYCISSLEGLDGEGKRTEASCTCLTEQGTRYELSQPECRTLARNGAPYNPYKSQQVAPMPAPLVQPVAAMPVPAVAGNVINRGERAIGTFPESPKFATDTFLTSPTQPSKL